MTLHFNKVTIVGVGLIGGSLARVIKEKGLASSITGVGRGLSNLKTAKNEGVIDRYTQDLEEGVKGAQLVVLATPVCTVLKMIEDIIPCLEKGTIITDVGSVKAEIVNSVERLLPADLFFVGGHPIAGTENSGVEASFLTLFEGRKCILTPTERTDPAALEKVRTLWRETGAEVITMDAGRHDRILSAASHLPHMVAYSLVNTLLEMSDGMDLLQYCAGGFKDFTRIASSSPEMWRDIAILNRDRIVEAITSFQEIVERLKNLIEEGDDQKIVKEFQKAKEVKEAIR